MAFSGSTTNSNEIIEEEDRVTIFVAYNGLWEYEGKEWVFENSKSSIMVVSKRITLSEISNILKEQLSVDKKFDRLKLEVHYRTGSPWFPVTEIQNNEDLSVFISETLKTKLPLCVTPLRCTDEIYSDDDEISSDVDEERQTGYVTVFVAYNGKWENDSKEWFFKNSESSTIFVPKHIKLSKLKDILNTELEVSEVLYRLELEVHYRTGSPWFPVTKITNNQRLSVFLSETSKTRLPLCVTLVKKELRPVVQERLTSDVDEERRKDDRVKKRLLKAIRKNDWAKAREIVNTEDVTWTSKLDDQGNTAFHFAVGRYKDIEVVREIIMGINSELLLTIVDTGGMNPVHVAALSGN